VINNAPLYDTVLSVGGCHDASLDERVGAVKTSGWGSAVGYHPLFSLSL